MMTKHSVTIDGKIYSLFYRHCDFATAEFRLKQQGWDISLLGPKAPEFWGDLSTETEDGAVLDQFRLGVLLYVGLLHGNPRMTLEGAQALITFANAGEVAAAVMPAVTESLAPLIERPVVSGSEEKSDPLAPSNGGPSAGPSPATTSD